jgi:predicted ferric reductase
MLVIGASAGTVIGLLLIAWWLAGWLDGGLRWINSGAFDIMSPALRDFLIHEASLMGWPLIGETSAYWYMSRGAGLVGYLLLWAATAWGLVISTKIAKGLVSAPVAASLHEFLSLGALAFAGLHALVLLGDEYIDFSLIDIIYPFAASYRPGWVGLGQLGFYLSAALALSFYLRRRIGPKTWRSLHYLTFLAFAMVLVHGLTSGTDASEPVVQLVYLLTTASIMFLIYYRLLAGGTGRNNECEPTGRKVD